MNTRGTSRAVITAVFALLIVFCSSESFGQAQYYHSRGIFLDDGAGHTVTLLPPTTGSGGGTMTMPPAGLIWPSSNSVGVLTNDGSGNLTWASSGGSFLPLAGGTMSGAIAMGGNNIANVGQMAIASATPIEDLTVGAGFGSNQTPIMVAGSATDAGSLFLGYSHPTVTANARYDGGGWQYNGNGAATMIDLNTGGLAVANAASGSAGGSVTWSSRMTLDASGNLSLPTGTLSVSGNATVNGIFIGTQGGSQSTGVGSSTTTSAANSTAFGFFANANSGTDNTAVGVNALRNAGGAIVPSFNTAVGEIAGQIGVGTGGNNNTYLGYNANANTAVTNSTALGSGATVTGSNTIQLGNGSVTSVNTSGTVTAGGFTGPGTGLTGTAASLSIGGNAGNVSGTVSIAHGGTGQTTQPNALTALLPVQSGTTNGQVLTSNGTTASWQTSGGSSLGMTFCNCQPTTSSASGFEGLSDGFGVNNLEAETTIPVACTLDGLYVTGICDVSTPGSNTVTVTVYDNEVATSMTTTLTIASTSAQVSGSDVTHTFSVTAGHRISLGITQSNTTPATTTCITTHFH